MATGRRSKGEGSIYQRADGRWMGVVDLGWVGGKRVRRTVSAPTLRELRPKMKALRDRIDKGVLPTTATTGEWVTYWLDEIAAPKLKPRTLDTYRGYADRWIVPQVGKVRLDALRPDHVRALDKAMREAGRASATRRHAYMVLRGALDAAVVEQRILVNPAKAVTAPPAGKGTHGVLDRDEALSVLILLREYGRGGEWGYVTRWLAALLAGLRQGEALGLEWSKVDLTPGRESLQIDQTVQRVAGKGLVLGGTKTDRTRWVPMVSPLAHAMRSHAQSGASGFVWGGAKPTDPRRDWGEWKMLLWQAGVSDHTLHAARASTASILGEANVPLRTIADVLGHSQITTSWVHYVHTDDRQMREGLERGFRGMIEF